MNITPISSFLNCKTHKPQYINIKQECNHRNFVNAPSYALKAYYLNNLPFKSNINKLNTIDLIFTDECVNPRISVKIIKNKDFTSSPGIYQVYQMSLNDQLYETLKRNPDLQEENSFIREDMRKIDITSPENKFGETLNIIKNEFANAEISKHHVDEAKELTKIGYELYLLTGNNKEDYADIPAGMTSDEYSKLIDNITYQDIENYNKEILANSDIKITLQINKDFYNSNKDHFTKVLNELLIKNVA